MGQATTDLNQVLIALNDRSDLIREDWRSFKRFNDTYAAAAQDILTVLDAASTTSTTVVNHSTSLDNLLLNVTGIAGAGTNLLATTKDNLAAAADVLEPTTNLLLKYSPTYTCLLQGAAFNLENGGYSVFGGADGRTLHFDATLLPGDRPLHVSRQPADPRRQGRTWRQAGLWVAARRSEELPGAPAGHQHRVGNWRGPSAQPRHRASLLCELVTGDPSRARAAKHPPVHTRAGNRAGPVPRSAAVRRRSVRAGRGAAVAGGSASRPRPGAGESRRERSDAAVNPDELPTAGDDRGTAERRRWRLGIFLAVCVSALRTAGGVWAVPVRGRPQFRRRVQPTSPACGMATSSGSPGWKSARSKRSLSTGTRR